MSPETHRLISKYFEMEALAPVKMKGKSGKTRLLKEFQILATQQDFVCHRGLVLDFGEGKGGNAIYMIINSLLDGFPH